MKQEVLALGLSWHGKGKWNNEQIDFLLDNYFLLYSNSKVLGGRHKLELACGRSFDAVGTKLRKLGIRCAGTDTTYLYSPLQRRDRSGSKFVNADYAFIERAFDPHGAGVLEYHANDPVWLAKVLARKTDEVRKELWRLAKRPEGFLDQQAPQRETDEEKLVRLIHEAIKGAFETMLRSLL